jgi:hypothetical protein
VAGKKDVRLTVALAAAQIDFEETDFLDIYINPNGATSTPIQLAHFRGVETGVQPWLADQKKGFVRPLAPEFSDFTYNIPTNATDLVVEFRVVSTWWNEILAIDNVRITEGAITAQPVFGPPTITGGNVRIGWTGGGRLQESTNLSSWSVLTNAPNPYQPTPGSAPYKFYRIISP